MIMTLSATGTLVPDTSDDGRMPLDWHGPQWHGDTFDADAERVTLPHSFDLEGEA